LNKELNFFKIFNDDSGIGHDPGIRISGEVNVSGSKSESNRLLILSSLYEGIKLGNLSNSDDTRYLAKALSSDSDLIDISHAGTAMRFLTAYFSTQEGREVILTGSRRMQERPIGILVEALRSLGADIEYQEKHGYPPLLIRGRKIAKGEVSIQGNVSSQYISALLLIAPSLEKGLRLHLVGEVTSVPYINMTLALLDDLGIECGWEGSTLFVSPAEKIRPATLTVESDWSSASYFFSLVALSEKGEVSLSAYKRNSLQGDSSLVEIYVNFGVETTFEDDRIRLRKVARHSDSLSLDLSSSPDLAQTIAVTCFGLGMACDLSGLHTLKIKETDRLVALEKELGKLGADIRVTDRSLHLKAPSGAENGAEIRSGVSIDTYDDHRMAMAFAPLAIKAPIIINDAEVVTKSFTNFWRDFESVIRAG
jgi:3-phosphoshikimate 1-carboxyvinyltransferase